MAVARTVVCAYALLAIALSGSPRWGAIAGSALPPPGSVLVVLRAVSAVAGLPAAHQPFRDTFGCAGQRNPRTRGRRGMSAHAPSGNPPRCVIIGWCGSPARGSAIVALVSAT